MKKIIVATDFSDYAEFAIKAAASIAKKAKAKLILLHIINRPLNSDDDSYENYHNRPGGKTIVSNIQNKLEEIINRHNINDAEVIYELRYDVFKTILKHANKQDVDLIVMGAYGSSGSQGALLGSNTERVLQQAIMPVLVVKEEFEYFRIENMVFASEFHSPVFEVYPKMKKIIDLFQTNIHLLKVNTPNNFQKTLDSLKLMEKFKNEFCLKNCTTNIYNDLSVEDGILNFSKLINADIIAITPNGYWRLAHIFNKNITNELMKKSIKIILSIKSENEYN